ncbi:hypothetical protein PAECIP111802_05306 [Paenibacillus allorhizosphaerae]|uniref:Endonuclease/exonuclease/phosphatase domain-containing protein n=2 Tax=Paenibacillus allorhizosphaerae TaxID=2849866 RepID=A0ABM8VPD7_9BACL|nr:hypothetical protein PAECIP111802_05306 [Paenibacillus allorhizosphaerae]
MVRIKLMSYNIRHGRGMDDQVDLSRVADVIKRSGADIVGIQEADEHWSERSDYEDQTAWLASELGMHHVYGGSIDLDPTAESRGHRRKHGAAVLSKHPIQASRQRLFSTCVKSRRELLETEIDVEGVVLHFYCTHWGLEAEERMIQSGETIQWMNEKIGPGVVVGDFNAEPGSPEMVRIFREFCDSCAGEPTSSALYTFAADRPVKRIDYMLGNRHIRLSNHEVIFTLASDHLPILCQAEFGIIEQRRGNPETGGSMARC